MNPIVEIEGIRFRYPSYEEGSPETPLVLRDVSLQIERGSFTAILGANGSGKSTLAKLCNAILVPNSGKVLVDGLDTADEDNLFAIRKRAGMVFQNPDNQIVATIVEEDVAFAPENLGVEPEEIRRRVDEALKTVGMYQYRKHAPSQLSGGQKQRVAIAGVIAMHPDLILLDEPTAMLDPSGRQEVMDTIQRLNRDEGITVVLITHYMEEAALADRIVVMGQGSILLDGSPKEVFSHVDLLHDCGLDVPQVTELCHALGRDGIVIPEECITVEECVEALERVFVKEGVDCS